jgi:uncharacterized membrane protein YjfL (UPF0719 family)
MGAELIIAGTVNLLSNFVYSFIALFIAIEVFIFIDKKVFDKIDIQKEIHDGNIAVAIFASMIILVIGIIIGSSMAIGI